MNNSFAISLENYSEAMIRLEKALAEFDLNQHETTLAQLLVEENFIRLRKFSSKPEDFSAHIDIKKQFGDINIVFSSKEEPFNPLKNLFDAKEDDSDYPNIQILKVNLDKLKYSRANGKNIILIKVHEYDNKAIRNTLAGLIFGVIIGLFFRTFVDHDINLWVIKNVINSLQAIFINALTMVVAPMIFFSIIDGIINISDATYIGRIGRRLIVFSLLKLAFYVALGIFAGYIVGGMPELLPMLQDDSGLIKNTDFSIRNLIVDIIPSDVITPFNGNNILQLIFLACFFGIMLNRAGEYAAWAREGVKFLSRFTVDVIGVLSLVIPFLVCVSMAELMINIGASGLVAYMGLILTVALGLPICFLISAALIALIGRIFPIPFLKKATRFSVLPFSLSSSNACLPATLNFCSEKLGMDEKLTKFAIPVGMQFNMDGVGYYVAVVSMMLAQTFGITIDANFLLAFFLIEFFMALTGIGLIIMPPMLDGLGIPQSAIAHFIGIEPILDMFGTAQSVVGNITSAFIITRLENKVDDKIYRSS